MNSLASSPTLREEIRLWQAGYTAIAGIDEAGRGALTGPVVAGAVILPSDCTYEGIWAAVKDSKLLRPNQREMLAVQIQQDAKAWSVGSASAREIDKIGIAPATRLAMARAIDALQPTPTYLLLDWVRLAAVNIPQESFTKGDRRVVSIAAASILAKTHRDALLVALHDRYPHYGFASHKGYATAAHIAAIEKHGPCPEHRHTFAPIRQDVSLFSDS